MFGPLSSWQQYGNIQADIQVLEKETIILHLDPKAVRRRLALSAWVELITELQSLPPQ